MSNERKDAPPAQTIPPTPGAPRSLASQPAALAGRTGMILPSRSQQSKRGGALQRDPAAGHHAATKDHPPEALGATRNAIRNPHIYNNLPTPKFVTTVGRGTVVEVNAGRSKPRPYKDSGRTAAGMALMPCKTPPKFSMITEEKTRTTPVSRLDRRSATNPQACQHAI